jgi:hypothetical protein
MSIRLTTTVKDGDTNVHAVDEWYSRFKYTMENNGTELRWLDRDVRKLMVDTAQLVLDPYSSSLQQLVTRNTRNRRQYLDLLDQLVEFDNEIREVIRACCGNGGTVADVYIPHDKLILVFQLEEVRRPNETGFETYIESCRGSGEYIHPELDKHLRHWRSIGGA